ncbi:sodium-dependent transporter [Clostridiisalibacter paucivorans]|uniref:sodium-dependent transporter n=1 Tax=Clostridiisalibacter paucivorans TaxID=408753 RepID=UPI00047D730A|nr:sodium-dependent transporter [Clostridiisalibacter paucivorans]
MGNKGQRDGFGSKLGIIAAAAGSAIGLGNIWRFPYLTGENGGAAFLFVYLICIIAVGLPVMLAEFVVGRRSQRNAIGAFKKLVPGTPWVLAGWLGVAAAFIILSFYGVIAGWTLDYILKSLTNGFAGKSPVELEQMFTTLISNPVKPVVFQLIFMALTAGIVLTGVSDGIEKFAKVLMPMLLVIIIILDIRAVTLNGASQGLSFLFSPDFSKIKPDMVLAALGQAFFSMSLGMGIMITYGSYIGKKENLGTTALSVSIADTLIALLAGIAIFPAVFAFGIDPNSGPGLVFITLPNVFNQMAGGQIFGILFFMLLAVAALTSTMSLMEVVVAYVTEEFNMSRKKTTILIASLISLLGVFASLSNGTISHIDFFGYNLFDFLDFVTSSFFLTIGAFIISIFVGWFMDKNAIRDEITNGGTLKVAYMGAFNVLIKIVAPIGIALVFLKGIGFM